MTAPITTIFRLALVAMLALSLAGCGGGEDNADNGSGDANGDAAGASTDSAAYRVVDQFIDHMANTEFAEAEELVNEGGGATILSQYREAKDTTLENPAASMIIDPIFARVTRMFSEARITDIELDDNSAEVVVMVRDEPFTLSVNSLDGSTWIIDLPQGMLVPTEELLQDSQSEIEEAGRRQNEQQGG